MGHFIRQNEPMLVRAAADVARFLDAVDAAGDCWLWKKSCHRQGYGKFWSSQFQKRMLAHRFAWFLANGNFPANKVLHSCDNPRCARPSHLFHGSQADNMRDMLAKKRGWVNDPVKKLAVIAKISATKRSQP